MLKKLAMALAGTFVAGSAFAAPASPLYSSIPAVQATVDLFGGFITGQGESAALIGGQGRANVPLDGMWNFQADAQFLTESFSGQAFTSSAGYMHFYKRDSRDYAVGVFAGYSNPLSVSTWTIGAEVQKYLGPWTLYGQGSASFASANGQSGRAFQLRGEAMYFLTPDTSVAADAMWTTASQFGNNVNVVTAALTGTHRFMGTPWGIFGQARWDSVSGDVTGSAFSGLAGLRLFADPMGSTQLSNQRTGPAMNVLPNPIVLGTIEDL